MSENQTQTETKAVREQMPEQNGVRRPKPGGAIAEVWEAAEKLSEKLGRPATRAEVRDVVGDSINPATFTTQYARWTKFHDIGSVLRANREAEAARLNAEKEAKKAEAKAAKEAEKARKAAAEKEAAQKKADADAAKAKEAADKAAQKEATKAAKVKAAAEAKAAKAAEKQNAAAPAAA